ncbi:MAG: divalent-cation tolerance protein CutA [Calditrichaeota bacterium]|nr:MAG: divalent-cation tolerance protein CutA [Calditrichota bacterium]
MQALLVYSTFPDEKSAREAARILLDKHLAACCTVTPGVRSLYHWQGKVENSEEILLTIKSALSCYPHLEDLLQKHHPYEVPEIIAHKIDLLSESYARWIESIVSEACP